MVSKKKSKVEPSVSWQVDTVRMTAFPEGSSVDLPVLEWWTYLAGEKPEAIITKPQDGSTVARGPWETGQLILTVDSSRLDLQVRSLPYAHESQRLFSLGDFENATSKLVSLATKLFSKIGFPVVRRLAFGAVLFLPAQDHEASSKNLKRYLPSVTLEPHEMKDFLYRINRPRDSGLGIAGLRINRLSTWQQVVIQAINLPRQDSGKSILPVYGVHLELDINTCQEFTGPLPAGKLQDILSELIQMGIEISQKGDIA